MKGRPWTKRDSDYLRRHYRTRPLEEIATALGRTVCAVKSRAAKIGVVRKDLWRPEEDGVLRRWFGRKPAAWIGEQIGRTDKQVWRRCCTLGLARRYKRITAADRRTIARMARAGACNPCIARSVGAWRGRIRRLRRLWGLPEVASSGAVDSCQWCKQRTRETTRRQLAAAGVPTLGALRTKVFRDRARAAGWPEDLRPRAVQILNLLYERGPMTRREIADAIGMRWRGSRASLTSNDSEGSYLAHLIRRGLVVSLGRAVKGKGRGHSTQLYAVPLTVEPRME